VEQDKNAGRSTGPLRNWRTVRPADYTLADKVCGFIESYAFVPQGKLAGKPRHLEPFERRFIYDLYDNEAGTRRAILSVARKNGKTALISAILLAYIAGPLGRRNAEIVSGAQSRDQAARIFSYAVKMVMQSPALADMVRIVPSGNRLVGLPLNVEFHAVAAEATTAMGLSPLVVILDETGQIKGPTNLFFDALTTAQGAYDDALQIIISTQAPTDADLLSILIDDALTGADPQTICHLYAAPADCALDDPAAWEAANPGLGSIRSRSDLENQIDRAMRLPSLENNVRNLLLNQRVQLTSPFLSPSVWDSCAGDVDESLFESGRPVYCGVDLAARTDLCAAVFAVEDDAGVIHLSPRVWSPADTLLERGLHDRAPYDAWRRAGLIDATPGTSVNYAFVARALAEAGDRMNLVRVHYDRWRIDILRQAIADLGAMLPLEECGQGYKDMSPAVEAFEALALAKQLRHGGNPVLRWNIANAVIERDAAGNRKLNKAKSFGRIDVAVAAVMAVRAFAVAGQTVDVDAMIG
jgi:phage terminase large subunit-like protein